MMKTILGSWAAVGVLAVATFAGAGEVMSGLKAGSRVPAFTVHDVTGPLKGEDLCYRCRYGAQPVVTIFAKEVTPEVVALTKQLDAVVAENRDAKMAGFVVVMSDAPEGVYDDLAKAAKDNKIEQLPLTTFKGMSGPSGYDLSKDADYTVMMWVDNKIKMSAGYHKGDLKDEMITSIVAKTKTILE